MILLHRMSQNRPLLILAVLSALSIFSMLSGTESTIIHQGIKRAVSFTAYPFLKAKSTLEGLAGDAFDIVFHYEQLKADNESLARESVQLRQTLADYGEKRQENERLRSLLGFVRKHPNLELEAVNVIQSARGMLTIDRGATHGIRESMGVIAPKGVVGIITEVYDFTASVATLNHTDCRVGAMVRRNRVRAYDGVIHAGGSDLSLICIMQYIDTKDDVRVGDPVVTSPESLFPAGYPIGVISYVREVDGLLITAEITPAVDPYQIDEVFVVRSSIPLEEELETDAARPIPPGNLADAAGEPRQPMSLQERYAP